VTITERQTSRGPRYRAEVWDNAARKRVTKTFPSKAAAKSWASAMENKVRLGEAAAFEPRTLEEAARDWLARAEAGTATNASGQAYKPSTARGYVHSLERHVLPVLGRTKLSQIRIDMVQAMIERMVLDGQAAQSIRNHITPLRVIFADARRQRLMGHNPLDGIKLPSGGTVRDRIAAPAEAVQLIAKLERDRALWATAFYTGLRRGELMALDWSCVDLVEREIRVERSYDPAAKNDGEASGRFVAPKTKAGTRTVPFPKLLLPFLAAEDRTEGLVFGLDGATPFNASAVRKRALTAWTEAGLEPITLHECRHTYASLMLAAGVDMTKVSKWMGHSSITITVDRYGHLVPGSARDDMARFEQFLRTDA
jgi:integrase